MRFHTISIILIGKKIILLNMQNYHYFLLHYSACIETLVSLENTPIESLHPENWTDYGVWFNRMAPKQIAQDTDKRVPQITKTGRALNK